MDVTYLQNNASLLIEHMRMDGYSASFIKLCRSATNHVINQSVQQAWSSYEDARKWFASAEQFSELTTSSKDLMFCMNSHTTRSMHIKWPVPATVLES